MSNCSLHDLYSIWNTYHRMPSVHKTRSLSDTVSAQRAESAPSFHYCHLCYSPSVFDINFARLSETRQHENEKKH